MSDPGDDVLGTENAIDTPHTPPDNQLLEVGLVPDYDNDSDSCYEVVYPWVGPPTRENVDVASEPTKPTEQEDAIEASTPTEDTDGAAGPSIPQNCATSHEGGWVAGANRATRILSLSPDGP